MLQSTSLIRSERASWHRNPQHITDPALLRCLSNSGVFNKTFISLCDNTTSSLLSRLIERSGIARESRPSQRNKNRSPQTVCLKNDSDAVVSLFLTMSKYSSISSMSSSGGSVLKCRATSCDTSHVIIQCTEALSTDDNLSFQGVCEEI